MATDLAVTVDDQPGVLARLGEVLGDAGINVDGVCGHAAGSQSMVHLLVDDADGAKRALDAAGFTSVDARDVAVVDVEDRPGTLGELARRVADAGVNIDLVYLASGTRVVLGAKDLEALRGALRR
jgi:hypothetical protein